MLYRPSIKLLGKRWGGLFGLVIVEYIFATYLWLSSCLLSPSYSFFSSLYVFFNCVPSKCMADTSDLTLETVPHEFHILLQSTTIHIFYHLFVIRLQSFLPKDLREKHILRTKSPGISQLSVMPYEAHSGYVFILNV